MGIIKEKKKKKNFNTNKIINGLKHLGFYLKLIFWVVIIILSLFVALLFIPEKNPDYKSDDDQMREWMEREKTRKLIYEMEDI